MTRRLIEQPGGDPSSSARRAELSLQQHSRKPQWRLIEGRDTPAALEAPLDLISILNVRLVRSRALSSFPAANKELKNSVNCLWRQSPKVTSRRASFEMVFAPPMETSSYRPTISAERHPTSAI